mgnify:CR=1 FL=1
MKIHISKYKIIFLVLILVSLNVNIMDTFAQISLVNIKGDAKVFTASQSKVTINGSLYNNFGANLSINGNVRISGDWRNDGNQIVSNGSIIEFFGPEDAEISGTGSTQFYQILLNKDTKTIELRLSTALTDTPSGFVELRKGTFRVIGNYAYSNKFFLLNAGIINIPGDAAFWLDNPNAVVESELADIILNGKLQISSGTFNAGQSIIYNSATTPAELVVSGGTTNVANRISSDSPTSATKLLNFTQSDGIINLATSGLQNDANPLFEINTPASEYNTSGGEIVLHNENLNPAVNEFSVHSTAFAVTNGTLKIDASSASQIFNINSSTPIGNLLMTGTNDPQVFLSTNDLNVVQNVTIAGSGANRFNLNGYDISLGGNWIHNIAQTSGLSQGNNEVIFVGNQLQEINGTLNPEFTILKVNKTAESVLMLKPVRVTEHIKLIGNVSIIDMTSNDLTLSPNAQIFADELENYEGLNYFNSSKYIVNSGSATDPLAGARLIKEVTPGNTSLVILPFPIGTPNAYTPVEIQIFPNRATYSANAQIGVKVVPQEHPRVETNDKSLTRYWNISSQNISFLNECGYLTFGYNAADIAGSEGNYRVLQFSPAYNSPSGYWRIDPGSSENIVDFNSKYFRTQTVDTLLGDWTSGEIVAASGIYYSRQNGNYNDPNTWSKVGYGGVPSTTVPNKMSDLVHIQGNEVTIDSPVTPIKLLAVETGINGRTNGVLKFVGENFISGDTFRIEPNAVVYLGSSEGISAAPTLTGNVQTTNRVLSSEATYIYWGGLTQVTGLGIPNNIKNLIVEKDTNTSVTLSKNTVIDSALHISNGILDMGGYTLNGSTSERSLTMSGGEFIVRSAFPQNYTSPTFTAGQITFDGDGNITIPSNTSIPAVQQYYDVKISSAARSGNVTLSGMGEIKIGHNLDLSQLNFANNTYKFFVDGSTVNFNGQGVDQLVEFTPASPLDSNCYLDYYNLIASGDGKLTISGNNPDATFTILKNLTLKNNTVFDANNFNIDIHGNWMNESGSFIPGTNTVRFISDVATISTHINSRSTIDNPFNNVIFSGPGIIDIYNNLRVNGNLQIDTTTTFFPQEFTVNVAGNWTNNGGIFNKGTSTIIFDGTTSSQNIYKSAGNGDFYNLTIQNPNSVYAYQVGGTTNGIEIFNNLNLNSGNLISHLDSEYRFVKLNGTITRTGGGFIDGEFRKNIDAGNTSKIFEVGYNKTYTPITLTMTGSGGTAGFVGVISDTITTTTNPIRWQDPTPNAIYPGDSRIEPQAHIARMFGVNIPNGSSFVLGNTRTYSTRLEYASGDVKPGVDAANFTVVLNKYATLQWIRQFSYNATSPIINGRGTNYITLSSIKNDFGYFLIGVPAITTYFSRQTGNWNDAQNWSLEYYNGTPASTYPGQDGNNYVAFIGDRDTITMTQNVTVTRTNIPVTLNASVIVDSTNGGGVLMMGTNRILGNGDFILMANGTIGIGDPAGITRAGAQGNIRVTGNRYYNYNSHNLGTFLYNGLTAQVTGNGLPVNADTVGSIIVNKPTGTVLTNSATTGQNITVNDSIFIESGTFAMNSNSGADLTVLGKFKLGANATFNSNNRIVYLRGFKPVHLAADSYSNVIQFSNLVVDKAFNTGNVIIDSATAIRISNNLTFASTNKVIINGNINSTELRPTYIQIDDGATVTGAGPFTLTSTNGGGWLWGEMRRYIASDDAPAVKFETGTAEYYSAFVLNFSTGTGSTAGYLGGKSIDGEHPMLNYGNIYQYPVAKSRQLAVYWRLTKPASSTFVRGNRNFDVIMNLNILAQATNTDCISCADLSFYRGGTLLDNTFYNNQWQGLFTFGSSENSSSGTGSGYCADTRFPNDVPNDLKFYYLGTSCSSTNADGTIGLNGITTNLAFGDNITYSNGDLLLADFVGGNRNSLKYYTFYSIKDGDWSDPTTWSTVGYNSTVNAAAADSADPVIRPVPVRQYDNVYIGNGKKVKLDMMVGINLWGSGNAGTYAGPSVNVENTGTLDFGTSVLRGNQLNVLAGGGLIVGAEDGIMKESSIYRGNVQLEQIVGGSPKISDSTNITYSPRGKTVNGRFIYMANRNATINWITDIRMSTGGTEFYRFDSRNKYLLSTYGNPLMPTSINLVPGTSYTITINTNSVTSKYYRLALLQYNNSTQWIYLNDAVQGTSSQNITFTIPDNAMFGANGTTILRVMTSTSSTAISATSYGNGEYEDYTIHLNKANYVANQVTGSALPKIMKKFVVTTNNSPANLQTVTPSSRVDFTVLDTMLLEKAQYNFYSNESVTVLRDLVVNNDYSLNNNNGSFIFSDVNPSHISGNANRISFNNLYLRKNSDSLYVNSNIYVKSLFQFDSANCVSLADNRSITLGHTANILSPLYGFNSNTKINVSGSNNSGTVVKEFYRTSSNFNGNLVIPVGIDSIYNGATLGLNLNAVSDTASIALKLRYGKHPNRLNDFILNKYWQINTTGNITYNANSNLQFAFSPIDTSAKSSEYIPGRWVPGWEIDLGDNPIGHPSPIIVTNYPYINGDWTTGDPSTYFNGRIYYSRNTGDWNNKQNWSTDTILTHNGQSASYFPGQIYDLDIVNIDGHNITVRNLNKILIDSLRIGGTNSNGISGNLIFDNNLVSTNLTTRSFFADADNGEININTTAGIDTLQVSQLFINRSNSPNGLQFYRDPSNNLVLKIVGSGNLSIDGEGTYRNLSNIIVDKIGGLSDTLIVNSTSFASATLPTSTTVQFMPLSGVIRNNSNTDLNLSSLNRPIEMGMYTGIDVVKLNTMTRSNLITNTNTTININGGNLIVGDATNQNLLYKTGTKITQTNGAITVAGAFARENNNSIVELIIENNASNIFKVNAIGNTQSDKIGFDMSNAASSISMYGGRIIVANANGTTPSVYDLRINTELGSGLVGGVIQSGDSLLTPAGTTIRIGSTTPMYDLHFANNPINNVLTQNTEQILVIKNNWNIDANHNFNLNGNTVKLGGNLVNYGVFNAVPASSSTNPWMIELFGANDQTLFNNTGNGLTLFNFRANKPTGNILLSTLGNSNLIIKNTLEFTSANNAIISTQENNNRYVEQSPLFGNSNQVLRSGKGHIYGYFYRHIPANAGSNQYAIGGNTLELYRPVTLQTIGTNTAGLVGAKFTNTEHPRISDALVNQSTNLEKYWTLKLPTTNAFALSAGQTYNLIVNYVDSVDFPIGSNPSEYDQYMYSPEFSLAGQWYELTTIEKTNSSSKSTNNTLFGDVTLAYPQGIVFYSIANGNWNDVNSWSNIGYESSVVATRIPNDPGDIVHVGNGKKITVPNALNPRVRSVIVEKYLGVPGYLQIDGTNTYISGNAFVLKDSCTLGIQHLNGINTTAEGARGAIVTLSRNYGVSRYVYNNNTGSQTSGNGLPNVVKALIIDNPTSGLNKSLFLYNALGVLDLVINDTLNINQGILNTSSRNIRILNTMRADSVRNDGELSAGTSRFTFFGGGNKNIDLANSRGIRFYDLRLDNSNVLIEHKTRRNTIYENIYVQNNLDFVGSGLYVLGDSVSMKILNSNPVSSITNFANNKFVRTSKTSGTLIRTVAPSQTYTYPIGSLENSTLYYAPAILQTLAGGTSGSMGIRTSWGKNINEAHINLSESNQAKYIKRYWAIDSVTMRINGKITFQYNDAEFLAGFSETDMTKIGRYRPTRERTGGYWQYPAPISNLNSVNNTFETNANTNFAEFEGDWVLGNDFAFRRIFFSRTNGNWNDINSWTFDPSHTGASSGVFPNSFDDSVVVGNNNRITLNINNPFTIITRVGISVGSANGTSPGILDLGINSLNGEYFTLNPNSTLMIGSPVGISSLGTNTGNILTTSSRNYSTEANYIYSGNSNQVMGNGIPNTVQSLQVQNTGTAGNNTLLIDRNMSVTNNFTLTSGQANLQTYSISGLTGSNVVLNANTTLRIGGSNSSINAIPGYSNYSGIDANSTIEFYGNGQDISSVPTLMYDPITKTGLGYGNVTVFNGDNQNVLNNILIRGNLTIDNNAILNVHQVDALEVQKNVINNATLNNNGIIEVGNCQ